jgi:hypothetical protein
MLTKVEGLKMTFEAIQAVRDELTQAARAGDNIKATEILLRLSNLYASIDAKAFIETMNELEANSNVIVVDFRAKKAARKVANGGEVPEVKEETIYEAWPTFTEDEIPF